MKLMCAVGAILIAALLTAPSAACEPPLRLSDVVTDNAGALNDRQHNDLQMEVDDLYREHHIRLWVVFVESFAPQNPLGWTRDTRSISGMNDQDAILAIATGQQSYAFLVPDAASGDSSTKVDAIRRYGIEPGLNSNDWAGAARAAVTGLATSEPESRGSYPMTPLVATAVAGLLVGSFAVMVGRNRRSRRRRARTVQGLDIFDPTALISVPIGTLDDLTRSILVEVDNAVRTSANELALALGEFGEIRTAPFAAAVCSARTLLTRAFTIRQQVDDDPLDREPDHRDLLIATIVSAAHANAELQTQSAAFHDMRDLLCNAEARLVILSRQRDALTARVPRYRRTLAELLAEFDDTALAPVAGSLEIARERLVFADRAIAKGLGLAAAPLFGEARELADNIRGAESALQQANTALDAMDRAAIDLHLAAGMLVPAVAEAQVVIDEATRQLTDGGAGQRPDLRAARSAAIETLTAVHNNGAANPLAALTELGQATADLDTQLIAVGSARVTAGHPNRSHESALFCAQALVCSVGDYLDTRRGSIGAAARTRLTEAARQLELAQAAKKADITDAITRAANASMRADQALRLAQDDVFASRSQYFTRYRGDDADLSAMIGGIILANIVTGGSESGYRGGGGGWTASTFGGSQIGDGSALCSDLL